MCVCVSERLTRNTHKSSRALDFHILRNDKKKNQQNQQSEKYSSQPSC